MKKILLILLVLLMSLGVISAEEAEEMDMAAILAMLEDPSALEDTDMTAFQEILANDEAATDENGDPILNEDGTAITVGDLIKETVGETIDELVADGTITQDVADLTTNVVTAIETATPDPVTGEVTLGAALEESGTSLDEISDSIAEVIAVMAVEQLTADQAAAEELSNGIALLKGVLGTLSKFGQANAQTSAATSLFGHQGYDLFAASVGITGSFASDMTTVNNVIKIIDSSPEEDLLMQELKAGGFNAGVSLQAFSASVGLNMNRLIDNLYLGVVFGSSNTTISSDGLDVGLLGKDIYHMDLDVQEIDDFGLNGSVNTSVYGVTANYQLIKSVKIPILYRWNGISVGTGIIYSGFTVDMEADLSQMLSSMATGEEEENADPNAIPAPSMELEPGSFVGSFKITSSAVTIPLEISTGVRLLSMVNLSLGAGADLKIGTSNVSFNLDGTIADSIGGKVMSALMDNLFALEDMSFPYNNEGPVELFNLKTMLGVGVGLGPVTLDVNLTAFSDVTFEEIGVIIGANFILRI